MSSIKMKEEWKYTVLVLYKQRLLICINAGSPGCVTKKTSTGKFGEVAATRYEGKQLQ